MGGLQPASPLPSALSPPSRPSSTPHAPPSKSSTPAARSCSPNPSTSPGARIPYSLGCFANIFLPSSQPAYVQLEKPQGRTYFAGDYLSHLVGWQEGAVLSAHHAIERIAKQIHA